MPRDYTAVFEDGTTYLVESVPDNVHPNDALAWTEQKMGRRVTEFVGHGRGPWGEAKEVAKDLARGAANVPAAAADYWSAFTRGKLGDFFDGKSEAVPGQKFVEDTIPTPRNDSPSRNLMRSGLQGASGALVGPGGITAPLRTAAVGGAAGIGSHIGGEAGGLPGALLGGLAGGLSVSALSSIKPSRQGLVNRALKDVTEQDLIDAKARMQSAQQNGVNLNVSQAMGKPSNIDAMTDTLANSQYGIRTAAQLHAQPTEITKALGAQKQGLPGTVQEPQAVANSVQDATTGIIKDVKGARTALVTPLYKAAGDLGPKAPQALVKTIDKFLAEKGLSDSTRKDAMALRAKILDLNGAPRTHSLDLKAAMDDFRSEIKSTINPKDAKAQGELKFLAGQLQSELGARSPLLRTANMVYSDVSKNVVDPLKKSVVGRMAQQTGALPDREAVRTKVFSVFDKGTLPDAQTSEILTLERSLRNGKQAEVFQDAAKTWLAEKVSGATKTSQGSPDAGVAASVKQALVGDEIKRRGLRDVMVGMARSKGLPDDALYPGMERLIDHIESAAKRPSKVQGISAQELDQASRNRVTSGVGNFSMVQPIRQPFRAIDDWLHRDAYSFMDKLLTSPEGVDMLRKMGQKPIMNKAVADSISTFLAVEAAETNPDPVTPR